MVAAWLLIGLAGTAGAAHAAEPVQVYGIAEWACGTLSSDMPVERSMSMTYVSGYISGLNAQRAEMGQSQVEIASGHEFFAVMIRECENHPDENMIEAATMAYASIIRAMPVSHRSRT